MRTHAVPATFVPVSDANADQQRHSDLVRERDQLLVDLNRILPMVDELLDETTYHIPDELRSDLLEVLRRGMVDLDKVSEVAPDEALERGIGALQEMSKGLSHGVPLLRGFVARDLLARPALDRWIAVTDLVDARLREWRRTRESLEAKWEAVRSASVATAAAEDSKRAAGQSGAGNLESAFEEYARKEETLATSFRTWTIGVLAIVIVAAGFAIGLPFFRPEETDLSWQQVVYRVAALAALAGLAAYLARQSAHHRRAAAWADAITVQLRAFPAFVRPIASERVRDEIYEAFGRRVLGAPPDFAGKSEEAMSPAMTTLIEALAKQARPSA